MDHALELIFRNSAREFTVLKQARDAIDRARVRACDGNGLTGAKQACDAQRETVRTLRQMGGVFHIEEIQEILGVLQAVRADVQPLPAPAPPPPPPAAPPKTRVLPAITFNRKL